MNTSPNILVICTDQHRYDAVSTDGSGPVITPNLAAIAREGANLRSLLLEQHHMQL